MTRILLASSIPAALLLAACAGKGSSPDAPTPTGDETGATVSIDVEEGVHYASMADLIRGQVPGLEVIERGGQIELRIRGMMPPPDLTSTGSGGESRTAQGGHTSTEPLLVIDGMTITPGNNSQALKGLNPSQVESVVVHKDVSSTVPWGMRGANGVIEIRMKRR